MRHTDSRAAGRKPLGSGDLSHIYQWMVRRRTTLNKQQKELLLILLGQAVVCLVIWSQVRFGHITEGIAVAWFVTDFAAAITLRLLQVIGGFLIVFGVMAAAVTAHLVTAIYDLATDPSLLNFFFVGLAATLIIAAFAAVVGVGVGSTFRPGVEYKRDD